MHKYYGGHKNIYEKDSDRCEFVNTCFETLSFLHMDPIQEDNIVNCSHVLLSASHLQVFIILTLYFLLLKKIVQCFFLL